MMENTEFAMEMLDRAQERFEDTFEQMTTEEANQMPARARIRSANLGFKWNGSIMDKRWLVREICFRFTGRYGRLSSYP